MLQRTADPREREDLKTLPFLALLPSICHKPDTFVCCAASCFSLRTAVILSKTDASGRGRRPQVVTMIPPPLSNFTCSDLPGCAGLQSHHKEMACR